MMALGGGAALTCAFNNVVTMSCSTRLLSGLKLPATAGARTVTILPPFGRMDEVDSLTIGAAVTVIKRGFYRRTPAVKRCLMLHSSVRVHAGAVMSSTPFPVVPTRYWHRLAGGRGRGGRGPRGGK